MSQEVAKNVLTHGALGQGLLTSLALEELGQCHWQAVWSLSPHKSLVGALSSLLKPGDEVAGEIVLHFLSWG